MEMKAEVWSVSSPAHHHQPWQSGVLCEYLEALLGPEVTGFFKN